MDGASSPRAGMGEPRGSQGTRPKTPQPESKNSTPARKGSSWIGTRRGPSSKSRLSTLHSRVCGEHCVHAVLDRRLFGSSPRVRGTLDDAPKKGARRRFIPAGAGNTGAPPAPRSSRPVHPRGCGEHLLLALSQRSRTGSSPRVRGTQLTIVSQIVNSRFIPAGAGNTPSGSMVRMFLTVHPRGCGEHLSHAHGKSTEAGSSPRVRGTLACRCSKKGIRRFIPAGAGNTEGGGKRWREGTVHPRGCGEHCRRHGQELRVRGSSPRVRGTRLAAYLARARSRFIPAGAGNTIPDNTAPVTWSVHPRGCGEHGISKAANASIIGSSPRVRGTRFQRPPLTHRSRFIPAGAGNTPHSRRRERRSPVHPRGCGEHEARDVSAVPSSGSSPRVRGTPRRTVAALRSRRFIPAGAGNT